MAGAVPYYNNPVGLTIGNISPGGRSMASDLSGYSRIKQSHSVNAVHMHKQENARISTFNQAVDRTNSTRPSSSYAAVGGSSPMVDITTTPVLENSNDGISMAELF
jgi:hypothetical protein